jgi:hypothetical protein
MMVRRDYLIRLFPFQKNIKKDMKRKFDLEREIGYMQRIIREEVMENMKSAQSEKKRITSLNDLSYSYQIR